MSACIVGVGVMGAISRPGEPCPLDPGAAPRSVPECTDQSVGRSRRRADARRGLQMSRTEARSDSRRSPNWQARRQAIIDTSAGVLAHSGYHPTRIKELFAADDTRKGAPYHYTRSQEGRLRLRTYTVERGG